MASETGLLFSVIIPTRHRDDLLALCLERLSPDVQSFPAERYELIVTDDGRETTSQAMIAARFPWVRWVAGPFNGIGSNRNNGVKNGSAPWIVFLDDDCLPSTEILARYANAIARDAAAEATPEIYEGRITCEAGVDSPLEGSPVNETGGRLWTCNMAVRRDSFEALRGFDEDFKMRHEDADFRERAFGAGYTMCFVPEAVVDHPPRSYTFGIRIAPKHEDDVRLYFKLGERGWFLPHQMWRLFSERIANYKQFRTHPDAKVILQSLFIEAAYIVKHSRQWEDKYRAYYEGTKTVYPAGTARKLNYVGKH